MRKVQDLMSNSAQTSNTGHVITLKNFAFPLFEQEGLLITS